MPRDRVVDWVQAHVPAGAVILDARPEVGVGFDRRRYEVLRADERRAPTDALLAEHVDVILTGPGLGRRWGRLRTLFPAGDERAPLQIQAVAEDRRPRYAAVPPALMRISASGSGERVGEMFDGDLRSAWSTGGVQAPGDWLELGFAEAVRVGRVELLLGDAPQRYAADLRTWVTRDGKEWRRVQDVSPRAPVEQQVAASRGASQVMAYEPQPVLGLRLAIGAAGDEPWQVAEMRVDRRE
jgi:hypothetical protein